MQGKRRDFTEDNEIPQPGEYGRHWFNGEWMCCAPGNSDMIGGLAKHTVVEHEDGTITVSPSILITYWSGKEYQQWHGYLERGVWREV